MKKLLPAFLISAILFSSCTNDTSKGKFFVEGELSAVPDQQIYLEELYFSEKNAEPMESFHFLQWLHSKAFTGYVPKAEKTLIFLSMTGIK